MEVAVVGAGAIGASYAGRLARLADPHLTFCVRHPFDRLVVDDLVAGTSVVVATW
jgi:ketopantoate reductase